MHKAIRTGTRLLRKTSIPDINSSVSAGRPGRQYRSPAQAISIGRTIVLFDRVCRKKVVSLAEKCLPLDSLER